MGPDILLSNDVSNQQDATTFSFTNIFKSALHVSGDKFAHPQEHFLTVYTACRADLKILMNEKFVVSCWLFTSLYQ